MKFAWFIVRYISDRTDSNADSTLDVSSADVSMYIMSFSAVQNELKATLFKSEEWSVSERTGKLCSYLGGDAPKRFKVKFIPNEHGDDMRACVLA
jgi:hypothetical protein